MVAAAQRRDLPRRAGLLARPHPPTRPVHARRALWITPMTSVSATGRSGTLSDYDRSCIARSAARAGVDTIEDHSRGGEGAVDAGGPRRVLLRRPGRSLGRLPPQSRRRSHGGLGERSAGDVGGRGRQSPQCGGHSPDTHAVPGVSTGPHHAALRARRWAGRGSAPAPATAQGPGRGCRRRRAHDVARPNGRRPGCGRLVRAGRLRVGRGSPTAAIPASRPSGTGGAGRAERMRGVSRGDGRNCARTSRTRRLDRPQRIRSVNRGRGFG